MCAAIACGARSSLDDDVVFGDGDASSISSADVGTSSRFDSSIAFKVGYITTSDYTVPISVWHSSTGEISSMGHSQAPFCYDCGPVFTYDGQLLVVGQFVGVYKSEIDILDEDGGVVTTFASPQEWLWSGEAIRPDGKRLVIAATMTDGPTYLATLDLDGTANPIPGSAGLLSVLYGPDGVTLVFLTNVLADGSYSQTLGTMHDDGSARRTIVSFPNANGASLVDPSFSFDGQLITYLQCDEHPNCLINVVDVASLEVKTVEASPTDKASPRFTPDGAGIVYYETNCDTTPCYGALQYVDVVTGTVSTLYKSENNFAPLSISSAVDTSE